MNPQVNGLVTIVTLQQNLGQLKNDCWLQWNLTARFRRKSRLYILQSIPKKYYYNFHSFQIRTIRLVVIHLTIFICLVFLIHKLTRGIDQKSKIFYWHIVNITKITYYVKGYRVFCDMATKGRVTFICTSHERIIGGKTNF